MIARLHGILIQKQSPHYALIDVSGVGYEVDMPLSTFCQLPVQGETITLLTHFIVREDAQLLYGFYSEAERLLFKNLIKISGVGPKMALLILSGMSVEQFSLAVRMADTVSLAKLPGIGKKTAERLVIEMKDRLTKMDDSLLPTSGLAGSLSAQDEAIAALMSLGYKPADAEKMLKSVQIHDLPAEELIRRALQSTLRNRTTND